MYCPFSAVCCFFFCFPQNATKGKTPDETPPVIPNCRPRGGASVGFVWDHGTALFINDGGNDICTVSQTAFGCADSYYDGRSDGKDVDKQETTYAVFIDTAGDDFYTSSSESWGFGRGGYFIDAEGSDHYISSQVGFLPADNVLRSDTVQMGGVCLDYSVTAETPAAPRISFWESAKKLGGIS